MSKFSSFMRCSRDIIDTSLDKDSPCSGRGDCLNGTCLCEIRFSGDECSAFNIPYHAGKSLNIFIFSIHI